MAGISDLINNIVGSVEGLVADLTGATPKDGSPSYYYGDAAYKSIQSQINKENWSKLSFPYTFSVINISNQSNSGSAKANGGFSDFSLPLNPQSLSQKEPPAITIRPTQGGTTTNHGGMRYKDLLIAGTTGIAPFRGEGGVNRKTGEAIFQPKDLKFKSGYEVFLHLRNWFRTYYEWKKKSGKAAKDYRLVFKNYKDGEFLIVELLSFEMERSSAKKFMYDYKMEFKVLSHFQVPKSEDNFSFEDNLDNALNKIDLARGVFLRSQGILRQIESTYNNTVLDPLRKTSLAIKALRGIPTVAADVSSRIIKNTISEAGAVAISLGISGMQAANKASGSLDSRIADIKLPKDIKSTVQSKGSAIIEDFGEGLMALDSSIFPPKTLEKSQSEQKDVLALPRNFYEDTISTLQRVKQNGEDFFNLGDASYDTLFGRTSTLSADETKTVTDEEYDLLFAFNEAVTGVYLLLSTNDLFKSTFDERVIDMVQRFNGDIQLQSSQAVKQIKYEGLSLERISQQELGDSNRWGELVELNNLKAPYISEDPNESRDGVLKLGDDLLIPVPVLNGFSQVPVGKENKATKNLSELERSLGCDFKLDGNFDLTLNNANDLEIVAGADNMAQAVILKLSYEPGEVMRHPELGAGILPGKKFPALEDIKDGVINTLLQDNRIQKIDDLALLRDNDALTLSFNLKIKNVDLPVPIKIKI